MNSATQLELPVLPFEASPVAKRQHIDFPLQSVPPVTVHELKRLRVGWGRGQTLRSLRLHGIR